MSPGLLPGVLGIIAFALTLPFTRIAVMDTSPLSVFVLRLVIASTLAIVVLGICRVSPPKREHWGSLAMVIFGVVFGFPWFSSLAMDSAGAAHGGVVLGVLPLATAVAGALLNRERPGLWFWLIAIVGSLLVIVYSILDNGSLSGASVYLMLAIACAALGYAKGGELSRVMPAWQVISWALAPGLPAGILMLLFLDAPLAEFMAVMHNDATSPHPNVADWMPEGPALLMLSLAYLGLISQYGGFLLWYRALALDGVAKASQLQLLQPFFTVIGAFFLLGETITSTTLFFAVLILVSVVLSRRLPAHKST